MEYIVKKTGYVAVKPSITVYKTKGDKVFIENPEHAKFLLGAKVVKSLKSAPENKMDNPVENKSGGEPEEFKTLSDDELKDRYTAIVGKKPHHKAGRESLIEKIQAAK